jgi:hypothetical protein
MLPLYFLFCVKQILTLYAAGYYLSNKPRERVVYDQLRAVLRHDATRGALLLL